MDLVEQLKEIVDMKRFDYIVIEASGICEPAPIAQTICSIPSLGPQYIENGILRLDSIVTVVDALRMKDEFSNGMPFTIQVLSNMLGFLSSSGLKPCSQRYRGVYAS